MESVMNISFEEFFKKISTYSSLMKLHFKLMNFLSFICYTSSTYYSFSNKYDGVEFSFNCGKQRCALCIVLVKFYNFEEMLGRKQHNEQLLKKYLDDFIPYLTEYYEVDKN